MKRDTVIRKKLEKIENLEIFVEIFSWRTVYKNCQYSYSAVWKDWSRLAENVFAKRHDRFGINLEIPSLIGQLPVWNYAKLYSLFPTWEMFKITSDYMEYVLQYMSKMTLNYINLVGLLYVQNDIKLKHRLKQLKSMKQQDPTHLGRKRINQQIKMPKTWAKPINGHNWLH